MHIHELRIKMITTMSEDQTLEWWKALIETQTDELTNPKSGSHMLPGESITVLGINNIGEK